MNEKDACKREVELAQEEAARVSRVWEEKVQGMKDEYETLLKSYENVSDEAERVRRVLEAARQERQELAARVRTNEVKRQEAERQAEEAQKEVDSVKDKMRKFAKTKQHKILELEEENEKLREMQEKPVRKRVDHSLKAEVERLEEEMEALKVELEATAAEKQSLGQQVEELREQLGQIREKEESEIQVAPLGSAAVVEEVVTAQKSDTLMTKAEPDETQYEDKEIEEETPEEHIVAASAPETHLQPAEEKRKGGKDRKCSSFVRG